MAVVSMKQFLEAGVHFGHQTKRWHPRMKPYIFGSKNGIHIVNLQLTLHGLKDAYTYARDLASRGENILFVGTKVQARDVIREEAVRANAFYINERWLGGLLTNFNTIRQSIAKLKRLEEARGPDGTYPGIIKKEAGQMEKDRLKLESSLGGIKEMRRPPGALFIIDCKKEKIAIQEAVKLGIPIIAVVDTNCDPAGITHVIPGNDDAIRSIRIFSATIANALLEGRSTYDARVRSQPPEEQLKPMSAAKRPARPKREGEDAGKKPKPTQGKGRSAAPKAAAKAPAAEKPAAEAPAGETPAGE